MPPFPARSAASLIAPALLASACGKSAPEAGMPPDAGPVAAATPKGPPPTPAEQCAALLDTTFAVARANLADINPLTASLEAPLRNNSDFVRVCTKLAEPERACLVAAESPAKAVLVCPNTSGEALILPDFSQLLAAARPATIKPSDAALTLARLAGTWRRTEATSGVVTTWTVTPDGTVTDASQLQGGVPVEGAALPARIAIAQGGRIELFWKTLGSQTFVFIEAGPDVFYASANMQAAPIHVPDPDGPFTLAVGTHFLRRDKDGACRFLTPTGHAEVARCALTGPGPAGERTFTADWPPPTGGAAERVAWQVHGTHFFHPDLVREGRFERQKPPEP